jgi:hypothetical protein
LADVGALPHVLYTLVCLADLHARSGQHERAAELLGLALRHTAAGSQVREIGTPLHETLRETLGAGELEGRLARGAALDLEQVVAEILQEA